ncbi:hypothetical protein HLRTI_002527 [Halorhabdus tiamatea SARL4B]|uniref:Uncharacterized protein n=1 Tax=Halorhabdus tiamatea SARL4B TaxID=1033806 RepID=F7PJB3_9EURY|nr:hypothetical protein [Halorhabdus tiamatea]ERJ05455.1 hypothetical protein HLRTI_002527 [Halorhabdus tiamatea SARL4B]CCQ33569.1 conserved hypothetical protein [Halorhabdus tiamatea SARL4B]
MSATTAGEKTVWKHVREEAAALAATLRVDGWDVCQVRADHVAAIELGDSAARTGLVYTVPDSVGEGLPALLEGGSFDRYEVFRTVAGGELYLVTRLRDEETERGVVLAGAVGLDQVAELAEAARERGELRTHVRLLDGTHLATFRHADPTDFFPEDG